MSTQKLLNKIFNYPELQNNPPVLIDIGASEKIHPKWKTIAKYSICVAFDADERDFKFIEKEQSNFKKLYVYNGVVTDQNIDKVSFYLTKSPYCSGFLKPNNNGLKNYLFSNLFEIEKTIELKSVHFQEALNNLRIERVDWFKTDSQGTDLRLFKCLNEDIRKKVLVAELEPGIIDTYEGEDKLYSIIEYFTKNNFWLSDIIIKGTPRILYEKFHSEFKGNIFKKLLKESIKKAPGWGEMTFINSFEYEKMTVREYLLGCVFSIIEKHNAFAFVLAGEGFERFNLNLFKEIERYSKIQMKKEVYLLKFFPSFIEYFKKRIIK